MVHMITYMRQQKMTEGKAYDVKENVKKRETLRIKYRIAVKWIRGQIVHLGKKHTMRVVIVGIDAYAKMGLAQQSDVLGKWYYPAESTSDNGDRLVDLCEHRAVWDVFDSDHRRFSLQDTVPQEKPRSSSSTEDRHGRKKLRRQLQQDRDNEWTSRAMEFEKAWEDKNPLKAYGLLRQYSSKMKRCSSVLNTANGVAVGEATLPIWRDHLKTLLNRQAPPAPELEHVHRPTYALNEEPPTDSEVLVCI
ncbi:hypothetical protein RB195_024344 [Necator americanus]|uniref:Uncharacterized protein n=1 Tax=Necator americanus TaxID=51031 RepID=A0ABR1EMU2_NECAM